MKQTYAIISLLAFVLFSSFTSNMDCKYASSNIGFAKIETEKALRNNDINQLRYHVYKALNAIENSKKQLSHCDCQYADKALEQGISDLKKATKASSLSASKILLQRALEYAESTLESLHEHHLHKSNYSDEVLALNTHDAEEQNAKIISSGIETLEDKIDISLEKYRKSIFKIVETVNCKDAKAFALGIYEQCEQQLLRPNLSEGKKYYNLRTKEITEQALQAIGDCSNAK